MKLQKYLFWKVKVILGAAVRYFLNFILLDSPIIGRVTATVWRQLLRARNSPSVAGDDANKQMRNETSRGVSEQVRLGTILRVGKTRKPRKTKGDG